MAGIADILTELENINKNDLDAIREFGALEMGPKGRSVETLLCADGVTTVKTSPQLREFYSYALWWKLSSVELEWINPEELADILRHPPIEEMVLQDTRGGRIQLEGMNERNSVLFSVDNLQAPFDRAYFVFLGKPEPAVVYAGSEVSVYDDLMEYLESWKASLGDYPEDS